jgi:cbb3-type cytochrome oxidase subunit 1
MFLVGMLLMAYNVIKTLTSRELEKPVSPVSSVSSVEAV